MSKSSSKNEGILDNIYSGTADFGQIWSLISAIFVTLIAIGLIIGGIYIIWHNSHLRQVQGQVVKSSYQCSTSSDKNGNKHTSCKVDVEYIVDNKRYTKTFNSATQYSSGQLITVFYEPNDPYDAYIEPLPKIIGWLMIVGAIVIAGMSWAWAYFAQKYKVVAAATGARGIYDILR